MNCVASISVMWTGKQKELVKGEREKRDKTDMQRREMEREFPEFLQSSSSCLQAVPEAQLYPQSCVLIINSPSKTSSLLRVSVTYK